ncbi:MAG: HEPN domain-containing protein [Methanospirillum sp.]
MTAPMVGSAVYRTPRPVSGEWRSSEEARELLGRARSSLALARSTGHGVMVEDLCMLARQTVERAVQAVLVAEGVPAPADGSIRSMLAALEDSGVEVPDRLERAANLFPGETPGEAVRIEKYYEAVLVATEAVRFAEARVRS